MEAADFYETLITIAYKNMISSKYFYTKELILLVPLNNLLMVS